MTTYAEAGNVRSDLDRAIGSLVAARYQAVNSTAYNFNNADNRPSFEHASLALEVANDLSVRAARCYMAAYPPHPLNR